MIARYIREAKIGKPTLFTEEEFIESFYQNTEDHRLCNNHELVTWAKVGNMHSYWQTMTHIYVKVEEGDEDPIRHVPACLYEKANPK